MRNYYYHLINYVDKLENVNLNKYIFKCYESFFEFLMKALLNSWKYKKVQINHIKNFEILKIHKEKAITFY